MFAILYDKVIKQVSKRANFSEHFFIQNCKFENHFLQKAIFTIFLSEKKHFNYRKYNHLPTKMPNRI